jgi:hypothetical protein
VTRIFSFFMMRSPFDNLFGFIHIRPAKRAVLPNAFHNLATGRTMTFQGDRAVGAAQKAAFHRAAASRTTCAQEKITFPPLPQGCNKRKRCKNNNRCRYYPKKMPFMRPAYAAKHDFLLNNRNFADNPQGIRTPGSGHSLSLGRCNIHNRAHPNNGRSRLRSMPRRAKAKPMWLFSRISS